tara:strand:- start:82 stop:309 length:228 start_codon:yes stop_codon:yes gene_type:complete
MNPNQPPGMKVDISKATDLVCECGSKLFRPVMAIKTLSALVSPTGQETMIPMQLYACIKCDAVPKKFQEEVDDLS